MPHKLKFIIQNVISQLLYYPFSLHGHESIFYDFVAKFLLVPAAKMYFSCKKNLLYLESIASMLVKCSSGVWKCNVCLFESKYSTNVRNHIEANHVASAGYSCHVCQKFCLTRNALNIHKLRYRHQS